MSVPLSPLYTPPPEVVARSQMTAFTRFCEQATGRRFDDYAALHAFSIEELRTFWALYLEWSQLGVGGSRDPVCVGDDIEKARFFPATELSYVDSLLDPRWGDKRPALTACSEERAPVRLSRAELRAQVLAVAGGLRALGVGPGDRVVAVAANRAESVLACLASAALGATWSSAAPDLGTGPLTDRFRPLEPALLFAHSSYIYQGAARSIADRLVELSAALPSLRALVALDAEPPPAPGRIRVTIADLLAHAPITPPRFPFNHPLFILFSSGTTGAPKCIVLGAGGTLVEHTKEHRLHGDLGPDDKLLFQTSCGWMMWNWQLSALASGTEIVLYDGSVSYPEPDTLWRVVERERVTVLGTSPAYLQYCRDAGIVPREHFDLSRLRALQSTGSILRDDLFVWVRDQVGPIPVQSISGGTDIIGCFLLGNPNLPVWPGELQCKSLGLDVRALRDPSLPGPAGELVCARPFPSCPLGLYDDAEGQRFHEAYFAQNPGFWTHGDFLELCASGGARIHGRSDGVLNIRGIRIGPAEIYRALAAGVPEVAEAMAIEQTAPAEPGGSRLVLLVLLRPGPPLDRALTLRIKKELAQRCSLAHVPAVVAEVHDLPTTHSGKRSERAARDLLNGRRLANRAALRNPESLDALAQHPALSPLPEPG